MRDCHFRRDKTGSDLPTSPNLSVPKQVFGPSFSWPPSLISGRYPGTPYFWTGVCGGGFEKIYSKLFSSELCPEADSLQRASNHTHAHSAIFHRKWNLSLLANMLGEKMWGWSSSVSAAEGRKDEEWDKLESKSVWPTLLTMLFIWSFRIIESWIDSDWLSRKSMKCRDVKA